LIYLRDFFTPEPKENHPGGGKRPGVKETGVSLTVQRGPHDPSQWMQTVAQGSPEPSSSSTEPAIG
jgi:hypothetical protein